VTTVLTRQATYV